MRTQKIIAAFCAAALLTGQVLYLPSLIVTEERVCAYLEENYGQIGNAVFWEYRSEIGTLTIYGEGAVDEREHYPWAELADPSLTQIIVENGVTNIPAGMFQGLSYVMDAEIAGTVTSIGANAFKDCTNLSSIELPGALTTLSGTAFDGTNITELHLPSALLGITDNYFSGCTWLESISGQSTGYYADGDALYTADKTKLLWHSDARNDSIFIPEGVTEIGAGVFQYDYIYQLNLPASLTLVGENAFYDCQITEVCFAGTQEQWNAIAKPADDSTLAKRSVRFGVQPLHILSADLNADGCVDAVDSAVMLQYAAAAGSGEAGDYALYRMQQGSPAAVCSNDTTDRSCCMDLSADEALNALDAAVVLQYAAAAGSGYAKGLSDYLSEIGSQT